ncbi:sensory box histidine kinase [Pedobacter sp. BAL39]|uniref:sensor histidine kinase n=1 Tax=Pedobacter sp. BAL39 TaxID=391596 RepID=UPI0001559CAA|nr:PAS domain-containing sensor histidine kinase [Pedobacter sp. BAL39]EDM37801.1 sensory box histidine kinase [Pedobacter sp. BAL39]
MQNLGEGAISAHAENQQVLNLLPIPIAILSGMEHHITFANDAMFEFWRRDRSEETIGRPVQVAFPELDSNYLRQLGQVMQTGITSKNEEVLLTLNDRHGQPYSIYIDYTYQPILDVDSKVTGVLVTAQDISHKVSAKKALQEASAQLENANCALKASNEECMMAIETAKLGTWKLKLVSQEIEATERAVEICGLKGKVSSFSEFIALVDPDYQKEVEVAFQESAENQTSLELEFPFFATGNTPERWIRLSGKPSQGSQNSDSTLSGTILDITDQKMEVIRKNQFIGMVSHELKTPLTSLTGMIQLIGRKVNAEADVQLQNILEKSLHQVSKMTHMINSFVNISRLESGKFELQQTEFDMEELIAEYLSEAQLTSPQHQFIQHDCQTVNLTADRLKIGAVLANMVSNAVKYSPQGSPITISCRKLAGHLEVAVKDHGCGIAESDRKRVFERFSHIHNAHVMNASGFGIGLYLCAEIIRHHQGEIWVDNNPDAGCTFYFKLPVNT